MGGTLDVLSLQWSILMGSKRLCGWILEGSWEGLGWVLDGLGLLGRLLVDAGPSFWKGLPRRELQEPPRCLATPRGASQYAGVPTPLRVLDSRFLVISPLRA